VKYKKGVIIEGVPRTFASFDEGVTTKEFFGLPDRDQAKLAAVLERHEHASDAECRPALVKDYGHGLLMIRHERAAYQGRCLFFRDGMLDGVEPLVIVAFYKKEANAVPRTVLDLALGRMKRFKEKR
jgi:hypothetical protein